MPPKSVQTVQTNMKDEFPAIQAPPVVVHMPPDVYVVIESQWGIGSQLKLKKYETKLGSPIQNLIKLSYPTPDIWKQNVFLFSKNTAADEKNETLYSYYLTDYIPVSGG